ncbi:MAG TPA: alpha/beta hydrolase [Trebonia sp.]|nr:alpha/beta hydrolase [Trebonia sp.]
MGLRVVSDDGGVLERRFEASSPGGGLVPGLLWSPSGRARTASPTATVLIGHGRTSHKRNPYILSLARRFAACGWHSVAIDAPGHGDRRAPDAEPEWPRPDVDESIRDWRAAVGLLREEAGLDDTRLAYWGMSMAASLGISLVADNPRFQAAALGLVHPNWPAPPGTRIRADAQRLECPVLFLVNWDDTRAPREAAFELFDLISSEDKRLHAYPGEHGQLPEEARAASEEFFARYLA